MIIKDLLILLKNELDLTGIVCFDDFLKSNCIDLKDIEIYKIDEFLLSNSYKVIINSKFKKTYFGKKNQELYRVDSISSMIRGLNMVREEFIFDGNIPFINDRELLKRNIDYDFYNKYTSSKKDLKNYQEYLNLSTNHEDIEYKNIYFRGQSRISYSLLPSLFRNEKYIKKERDMYNEIVSRCPFEFRDAETHLEVLQKMQHYSLPTRLLDISTNVLIALYFACIEDIEFDSEILVFSPNENEIKNAYSDTIELLCSLACITNDDKLIINELLGDYKSKKISKDEFNKRDSVQKLVHEVRRMTGSFESKIDPDNLNSIYFVKPIRSNDRIVKQDGAFIVVGFLNQNSLDKMQRTIIEKISENVVQTEGKRMRYIVPSSSKKKIIGELNLMGINQSTIYPEIERVSQFIKSTSLK